MPDDDERAPFLPRERALVADAIDSGVPVLGICLGAQVLAHVAGGEVTAESGETERGSCPIAAAARRRRRPAVRSPDRLRRAPDDPEPPGLDHGAAARRRAPRHVGGVPGAGVPRRHGCVGCPVPPRGCGAAAGHLGRDDAGRRRVRSGRLGRPGRGATVHSTTNRRVRWSAPSPTSSVPCRHAGRPLMPATGSHSDGEPIVAYCIRRAGGPVLAEREADEMFYAASTVKLAVLAAVARAIADGTVTLEHAAHEHRHVPVRRAGRRPTSASIPTTSTRACQRQARRCRSPTWSSG